MKTFFFLCFLVFLSFSNIYALEPSPRNLLQNTANMQQLRAYLLTKEHWVPYPNYKNRTAWNQLTKGYANELIHQGESKLDYQWQVVKATDYLAFERTGDRGIMERPYNQNVSALAQLILAELAEGKGRFMDQIVNDAWAICDMQSWSLSAHLNVQKSKRSLPDASEEIIDLVSGDVGSLLSWAHYFFKEDWNKINPVIAKRVQQNIKKRILEPYMQRSDYWWQALQGKPNQMVNNWNPWCNANVLACFLLMENNADSLTVAVHKTMQSVDQFINYVKEDGACEEGPSYWGHAAGKLYDYLQLLSTATGGKISIFQKPMIKNMGEYISRSYVGNGWVVNFADAAAKESTDPGLIYRFGTAVASTEMHSFSQFLLSTNANKKLIPSGRDMFRILESILNFQQMSSANSSSFNTPNHTWYPQTEVCYMKNKNLFFAAKGGYNDESHNHNDIGSFNLYFDAIPFIIDIGVGTYTRQTFSSERYTIWTMQSNYHNLPIINGTAQSYGRKYKAKSASFNASKNQFQLDIANAYNANAGVEKWNRIFTVSSDGLILKDQYQLNKHSDSTISNFMTWAQPQINEKGKVFLEKNGKKIVIEYHPNLLTPFVESVNISDKKLSAIWGNTVYRLSFYLKSTKLSNQYTLTFKPL
ncbi:MAG: heparinase [Chitinophagaceae bacterium]|nr:MAG: heparinase [Chitinophagaceae bacterium]